MREQDRQKRAERNCRTEWFCHIFFSKNIMEELVYLELETPNQMNFLAILSAIYGLAGAFYVVYAKLRLHLRIRSGKETEQLGQFVARIDRQSTEVFIEILGFMLIGFAFSIGIISAFADYEDSWGFTLALVGNLAAIVAIIRVGLVRLANYDDEALRGPTAIPLNAPGIVLPILLIIVYISTLTSVALRFFNLPEDWIAFAGFFGIPSLVQYLVFPLLSGAHLIQGERARAPPWRWFAASLLCVVVGFGFIAYPLVPGGMMARMTLAYLLWSFAFCLWFLATIMISS
jgi:hypothetical protein